MADEKVEIKVMNQFIFIRYRRVRYYYLKQSILLGFARSLGRLVT